jgi:hypothetical protein
MGYFVQNPSFLLFDNVITLSSMDMLFEGKVTLSMSYSFNP